MSHTFSPDQQVAEWLAKFDRGLASGDAHAVTGLFREDALWRDIVSFTWNIHTAEGLAAIGRLVDACATETAPHRFTADAGAARMTNGIVESEFTFETKVSRGRGIVRLVDGRCWTLLTAMVELKGHEEQIGRLRPLVAPSAYRPGRQTWLA